MASLVLRCHNDSEFGKLDCGLSQIVFDRGLDKYSLSALLSAFIGETMHACRRYPIGR